MSGHWVRSRNSPFPRAAFAVPPTASFRRRPKRGKSTLSRSSERLVLGRRPTPAWACVLILCRAGLRHATVARVYRRGGPRMSKVEGRRRPHGVACRKWLAACLIAFASSAAAIAPGARAAVWQPSPGHVQAPIWPGTAPDLVPDPKPESGASTHVSRPTMTVYGPKGRNTGVAVVVFPGGGYQVLAMDLEGTEICDWLTSRGITCVLLKYRVPNSGPTMKNSHRYYPRVQTALQ